MAVASSSLHFPRGDYQLGWLPEDHHCLSLYYYAGILEESVRVPIVVDTVRWMADRDPRSHHCLASSERPEQALEEYAQQSGAKKMGTAVTEPRSLVRHELAASRGHGRLVPPLDAGSFSLAVVCTALFVSGQRGWIRGRAPTQ